MAHLRGRFLFSLIATLCIALTACTGGGTLSSMPPPTPPSVASVSINQALLTGGANTTGIVTLSSPAPAAGINVALMSSNSAAASVPATANVPGGATTSASFTVTSSPVAAQTVVTITATLNGTATGTVTVKAPVVTSLTFNPGSVKSGQASTGTITLNGNAPSGFNVGLMSSNTTAVPVPASVAVPAGTNSTTFIVTTGTVSTLTMATVTATTGTTAVMANLSVNPVVMNPPSVTALSFNPAAVTGGTSSTGMVTINAAAPSGGIAVSLSSPNAAVTVPGNVTVAQGATTATFTAMTVGVAVATPVIVTATLNGTANGTLTVNPPTITSVTFSPNSVPGGTGSTGTVALSGPAPPAGFTVSLMSNMTSAATVPMNFNFTGGSKTDTFTVTTFNVASTVNVTITATLPSGNSVGGTLSVNPAATAFLQALYFNPATVTGGPGAAGTATGTVVLSQAAPAAGVTVNLSSNDAHVTVPSTVTVTSGNRSQTFTATTASVNSPLKATVTATQANSLMNTLQVNPPLPGSVSEQIVIGGETSSPDFPDVFNAQSPFNSLTGTDSGYVTSINLRTTNGVVTTTTPATFSLYTNPGATLGQVRDTFIDPSGNVYACGVTDQQNLPTTQGVLQPSFGGPYKDAFLMKLSPAGKVLALSYLGGDNPNNPNGDAETICYSIFVDANNFVYISGRTSASRFPTFSPNGFQKVYGGGSTTPPHVGGDFFVAKLNPGFAGPAPVWFTYLGGMNDDTGRGRLAVDSQGNVYVGGASLSTSDFPTGLGPVRPTNIPANTNFGVLVKFSSDGTQLLWTKFFYGTAFSGSPTTNASGGTIVDKRDNVYVCGFTKTSDFLTQIGAPAGGFQTAFKGQAQAYVAMVSPGGAVLAATLLGGSGNGSSNTEECKGLVQDVEGNVLFITSTNSTDFPTTPGAFRRTLKGSSDMAVGKLTPNLDQLVFSTLMGGSVSTISGGTGHENVDADQVELDAYENIWVAFFTDSSDLQTQGVVTSNAFQTMLTSTGSPKSCTGGATAGCTSVAFAELSADGSRILYGSYLGGTGADNPRTIRYRKN